MREALDAVRDSDSPDSRHVRIVEDELKRVWRRISDKPNSYVMSDLEFAIFNHHRNRDEYRNSTAQKAVERYWANRRN
jgi:phosphate uptake regulator